MLKKLLSLLSDAAVYGISGMMTRLVGFFLLFVLARYLNQEDYGVLSMLTVLGAVYIPISNLGMTNAVFRRFNLEKEPAVRAEVLSTGLASVAVSSCTLLAVGQLLAPDITELILGDQTHVGLVRISLLTSALAAVSLVPFATLRAGRRVKAAAGVNIAKVIVAASVTLWFVIGLGWGLRGVVVAGLVAEAIVLVGQLVLTARAFASAAKWTTWKRMASYGLPFVPHHVQAVGLDMFTLYMVREMLGLGAAGLYGVAMRFTSPLSFIVNAVQTSWVPYKFQIHAEDDDPAGFFRSAFLYYVAAVSYLWVGVALWGPEMVRLLMPVGFHGAAPLMWAVALIPVSMGLYYMAGTGIELSENTRPMPLVSFAGLVMVIVLAWVLVDRFEAIGAAIATSTGWLTMAIVVYNLSQRRMPIRYDWFTVALFVLMAAGYVVVGSQLAGQPLAIRLIGLTLLSLAYPITGFMLMLRNPRERVRALNLLSRFHLVPSNR